MAGQESALAAAIAEVVEALRPDEVLVTGEDDPHEDHAVLGAAARRALTGTGVRLLAYPIWQFDRPTRLFRHLRPGAKPEIVRTDGYRVRKRRAVAAYPSQMAADDDDPEGLKPRFLPNFDGPYEMFFPVDTARAGGPGLNRSGSGADLGDALAGGAVHGVLVELRQDVLAEGGHGLLAQLDGHGGRQHAEAELVGTGVGEALDGTRHLVGARPRR